MEIFLDYIDFTHPGLKRRLSHLSVLLSGIVHYGILPPQRLVLEKLPYSRLSEVGDRPLEDLLQYCAEDQNDIEPAPGLPQYCTEDQNAIKLTQGTIPDRPLEDPDQLSSPISRMAGGTPSDSAIDFNEYVDCSTADVLWAGDCEHRLNTPAIEAKNIMIVDSQASRLDNKFLLSPMVIYQGISNRFEVLVG